VRKFTYNPMGDTLSFEDGTTATMEFVYDLLNTPAGTIYEFMGKDKFTGVITVRSLVSLEKRSVRTEED
jgi:hypothetical protein